MRSVPAEPTPHEDGSGSTADIAVIMRSPGYLRVLGMSALVGIPLSVVAFAFLVVLHQLEHLVWHTLPESLGYEVPPAWWPVAAIGLAGLLVGLTVRHLPGHGGHVPVAGLAGDSAKVRDLPGVVLAALAGLSCGAVLGPEAPLIAVGGGLALLAVTHTRIAADPRATALVVAAGSAAAIAAIFGNPLVAAILFLEVVALARGQVMLVVVPCLISTGVGALLFTGLGDWTGLEIGALSIPDLQPVSLDLVDLVLSVPLAAVVAVGVVGIFIVGRRTAGIAYSQPVVTPVAVGLIAGAGAALYAVVSGRSPEDVALSGQIMLGILAAHPEQWSVGTLILLLLCKSLAYALCLGAFRGGPVFPAVVLGAATGVLAGALLPGIDSVSGIAVGMAAGVAATTRLPVTSCILVVLLLGEAAFSLMPVVIVAVVTALIVAGAADRTHDLALGG